MRATRFGSPRRWLAGGLLLAVAAVAVLSLAVGGQPYEQVGNADPAVVTAVGAPLLRLAADICATVCVGALAFAARCTKPQPSGLLSPAGYGEVRVAAAAAVGWCVCAVALVPFSAADTAGVPLSDALVPQHLIELVSATEQPKAWLVTTVITAVVAAGCRSTLRWQPAVTFLGLAVLGVLPALVAGHGSSDANHDLSLAVIVIHVPAATVWLGLLLAVLRQRRSREPELLVGYRTVAWWCWLVLVASGLVLGGVLIDPGQLLTTAYGLVLVVKTLVVVALGIGARTLRNRERFVRAELVLLLGVLGASVDLTHLSIPDFLGRALSTDQTLLGYDLAGPPTLARLLLDWRPDLFFGPLAVLLAVGYLLRVRRIRARGRSWSTVRTTAWLAGCLVLLVATSSGIGRYAAAMFSVHQLSHMLYSMLAPALLVLGGPLTLFDAAPRYRPLHALTQPMVALVLFAGSPFALYFTGLFDAAVRFHWAHLLIEVWFLLVGYLFFWSLIGIDATPRPLPNLARLGMLLAAMPADVVFGAALIGTGRVIGNGVAAANLYQALGLPWVPDLLADQRLGGIIALAVSELTLFVVLAALLVSWNRVDELSYPALIETPQPQAVGHHEQ